MDRWESRDGKSQRREEQKREDQRRERVRRKKMQVREKVAKWRNTVFCQWFVAPEGRKVGSLKRRVRSHVARWGMKNCTPLWREAHFQVKLHNTPQLRSAFGSWDVEKVHAVVARSKIRSQTCKKDGLGPLLEVQMSKKCTPLWRKAHVQVTNVQKHHMFGPLFGDQMSFCVAGATDCAPCQKSANREDFVTLSTTTTTTPHYVTLHYTTTTSTATTTTKLQLHYITLHYTNHITLHYTTLHSTRLR